MTEISSILPKIRGPLDQESENDLEYNVGCNTPKSQETTPKLGYSVVYPKNMGEMLPTVGGGILKISGYSGINMNTETVEGDSQKVKEIIEENRKKINSDGYRREIMGFDSALNKSLLDDEDELVSGEAIDSLSVIRVAANRALDLFPDQSWINAGIPELYLKSEFAKDILDADNIVKSAEESPNKKILNNVGGFKFVPFQILAEMISAISVALGEADLVGSSGKYIQDIAINLSENYDNLSDDDVASVLTELLPIYHLTNNQLVGLKSATSTIPDIGYYTSYKDSLFLKSPDLSARSSKGGSDNFYDLGAGNKDNLRRIFFALEAELDSKYSLKRLAVPRAISPVLESASIQYGGSSDAFIDFSLFGLGDTNLDKCHFFLAPAIDVRNIASTYELKPSSQYVEIFSAPNMMEPPTSGENPTLFGLGEGDVSAARLDGYSNVFVELDKQLYNSEIFSLGSSGVINKFDIEDPYIFQIGDTKFNIKDLGYPNTVDLSTVGIDDVGKLLGEMNRSDVALLNDSDFDTIGMSENDAIYFKNKICSVRSLMSSNRGNFIDLKDVKTISKVDKQHQDWPKSIPALWLRNSGPSILIKDEENNREFYSVPFSSKELHMFSEEKSLKFVVYVIDEYGQIFKATNRYIEARRSPPDNIELSLEFKFHKKFIVKGSDYPHFVFEGENLDGITGIRFVEGNQERDMMFSNPFIDLIESTDTKLEFSGEAFDASFNELTGLRGNVGDLELRFLSENGMEYPVGDFLLQVVDEDATKEGLDEKKIPFTKIKDPLNEIFPDGYGELDGIKYAYNVPILSDGSSATIRLGSKSGILKPSNNLYAYLMICNEGGISDGNPIYDFSMDSHIIDVENPDQIIDGVEIAQIAKNIEFKLGKSGDFASNGSDSAELSFPGSKHALNFTKLPNLKFAYFIILSQRIGDITSTNTISALQLYEKHALVRIGPTNEGSSGQSAFITHPNITGLFSKIGEEGGYVSSTDIIKKLSTKDKKTLTDFDVYVSTTQQKNSQRILVKDRIENLAAVFEGYNSKFKYKLALDGVPILGTPNIVDLDTGGMGAIVYDEVTSGVRGWVDVSLIVNDTLYNIEYDSSIYGGSTAHIRNASDLTFSLNGIVYSGNKLRLTNVKGGDGLPIDNSSGLTGLNIDDNSIPIHSEGIIQTSLGRKNNKTYGGIDIIPINPIKIEPNVDLYIGEKISKEGKTKVVGGIKTEDKPDPDSGLKVASEFPLSASGGFAPSDPVPEDPIGDFGLDLLTGKDPLNISGPTSSSRDSNGLLDSVDARAIFLNSGAIIPSSILIANDSATEYKISVKALSKYSSGIRFNIPELLYVQEQGSPTIYYPEKMPGETDDEKLLKDLVLTPKKKLKVTTIGTDEHTFYFIADLRVDVVGPIAYSGIEVTANIIVPEFEEGHLDKFDPCKTLRISNANKESKKMGSSIGDNLSVLVDEIMKDLAGAGDFAKGKIKELKRLIKKYLLKFTKFTMDVSSTAKEFINSFCDLSFHLTAELKFNLRNLQLLYIPIKVIMCIIDVLCALLNPWKTARAVVRLFACLYDLLLLLPQISIPLMLLNLLLHLLELLQCVFIKIIGWMVAINEIIVALDNAIKKKDYGSIKALEKTLSEHLFSLNSEIEVLEPILGILLMFLEMMELIFNFSCSTGRGSMNMDPPGDAETCLDPTMIAGMVVGKAMPNGNIDPSKVLPLAQSYTQWPPDCVTSGGNTPSNSYNNRPRIEGCAGLPDDVLVEPENGLKITTLDRSHENIFLGEETDDGFEKVKGETLRFDSDQDFNATFGVSFSKSVKYNSNALDIKFEFNSAGKTDNLAFDGFFGMFYDPKLISDLQSLDSPPAVLSLRGEELAVSESSPSSAQDGRTGFVSPVDGHTGFFLEGTDNIAPLTMPVSSYHREYEDDGTPIEPLIETTTEKVFPGVPKVAIIDDNANVYFIKENGISFSGNRITSIKAKLINQLSAPKMKTSTEKKDVFRKVGGVPGEKIVGMQANATAVAALNPEIDLNSHAFSSDKSVDEGWDEPKIEADATGLIGLVLDFIDLTIIVLLNLIIEAINAIAFGAGPDKIDPMGEKFIDRPADGWADMLPHPEYPIKNFMATSDDLDTLRSAVQTLSILDFPRLYFFDMREVADDISQACQTADLNGAIFDINTPDADLQRVWPDDFRPIVTDTQSCIELLKNFIESGTDSIFDALSNSGSVEELLANLDQSKWDMDKVSDLYDTLRDCVSGAIDDTCSWVVNPLNTGFKLIADTEPSGIPMVDPTTDFNEDIDDGVTNLPSVTGAAEYASGIGDFVSAIAGERVFVEILPRDSHDDPLSEAGDWSSNIRVEIVSDTTGGTARLVAPNDDGAELIVKEGEKYIAAVMADSHGQVRIRAYISGVMVKAWAERGIVVPDGDNLSDGDVDCVPSAGDAELDSQLFGPGSIMKIDRVLTIAYKKSKQSTRSSDNDAGLAKSNPQVFGTELEN